MKTLVCQATEADLAAILELHNVVHQQDPWDLERIQQIYAYQLPILITKREQQIIGVLIYLICLDEVRIINLAVHPLFQRQGYGQELMYMLLREAQTQNWRYILLDVRCSNLKAVYFYSKRGFRILCTRHNFYDTEDANEDAYFMQLELASRYAQSYDQDEESVCQLIQSPH